MESGARRRSWPQRVIRCRRHGTRSKVKPTLFRGLRNRGVRSDDLRVDGAGKHLEKCARPSTIGWKVPLLGPDAGSNHPVAGVEIGRQSARNSKADDAAAPRLAAASSEATSWEA